MTLPAGARSEETGLRGRVAIVTGASAGIGDACCRELARAGVHLVILGRDPARLERVEAAATEAGAASVTSWTGDVREAATVEQAAESAVERFGRIDLLIASAGILRPRGAHTLKMLTQMSASEWDEVLDVNLRGTYLAIRAVLPAMMRQRSGQILTMSSTSGRRGHAFDTAYCASKFAVIGLTEAVRAEAAPYGVKVDVVLPGAIDTGMWGQNGPFRAPEHAVQPGSVASAVMAMLTLAEDTCWHAPEVAPFAKPEAASWRSAGGAR